LAWAPNNSMEPTWPAAAKRMRDTSLALARRLISRPLGASDHPRETYRRGSAMRSFARTSVSFLTLTVSFIALLIACTWALINILPPRLFSRWQPLGRPPERPTSILAADQRPSVTDVYVATDSGRVYHCCAATNATWQVAPPTDFALRRPCLYPFEMYYSRFQLPPGVMVDCSETTAFESPDQALYVILKDDSVWRGHHAGSFGTNAILASAAYISLMTIWLLDIRWKQSHKAHIPWRRPTGGPPSS